jgi:signal transduction histidine kinase
VEQQPVRLLPLLSELIELHRDIYPDCQIELEARADAPLMVDGDAELLRLIFSNLVNNAIKYSPNWQRVALYAGLDAGRVRVAVRDWGVGIPEAEQERLFTRFFRASTSQGIPGSGIGLSLVRELVQMHGGEISVQSSEGNGSVFTVLLPLSASVHPQIGAPWQPPAG